MKLVILLLLALTATPTFAQTVDFTWAQPDSTTGTLQTDGSVCCKTALADGDLATYEIFIATPTDTLFFATIPAPAEITALVTTLIPVQMLTPTSIQVRAIDIRGNTSQLSLWSDPLTIDPGPPAPPSQPIPSTIYFEGQ